LQLQLTNELVNIAAMKIPKDQINKITDARLRLLEAAVWLFAEQGINGTTVAEIAQLADVTSAMVHYYFKTKDQLLDAVVDEKLVGEFFTFVDVVQIQEQTSAIELVENLVWRIINATDKMPWLPPLWIREVLSEGGMLREKLIVHAGFGKKLNFKEIFIMAQQEGKINNEIDPGLLFLSVMGLTLLPLSVAKSWECIPLIGKVSKQELGKHVTALLKNGLAVPGSERK
jgi:AcrR family transcriptional regulator